MTSCPGRNNEAQQKGVIKSFAKPVLSVLVWCFCNCVHPHDRLHVTKAFLSHFALSDVFVPRQMNVNRLVMLVCPDDIRYSNNHNHMMT